MFEWLKNLDSAVQAAIITTFGPILSAIIAGILALKKKGNSSNKTNIKQKQKGKYNTQIGIQNNYGSDGKADERKHNQYSKRL